MRFKQWASRLLLLIVLLESGAKTFLLLDYELRLNYYSEVLCIRKEVINNSCKGMCHLTQEMKKEEEMEKKQGHSFSVKYDFVFLAISEDFPLYPGSSDGNEQCHYRSFIHSGFPDPVFRPPLG